MKLNKLNLLGDSLEIISNLTNESVTTIIDALVGVCFSEEDAGELKEHFRDYD